VSIMTDVLISHDGTPSAKDNIQAVVDEKIRQMEEKYDLLQYKVDGWSIWTILRFSIAYRIVDIGLNSATARSDLVKRFGIALRSLPAMLLLKKAKYLVKTYTSARGEQRDGLYKDIYFDDLLIELGGAIKIESINNMMMWERSRQALVPSDIYTPIIDLIVFVLKTFLGTARRFIGIGQELSKIFERELSLQICPSWLANFLANYYLSKKIYGWLLDRIKPKFVMTADSGEFALLAAAKERGIQTMEIGHGFCDRYYWPYSWGQYAVPYKPAMPVPDKLLVYGAYLQDEYNTRGFWGDSIKVVGSLRIDDFRNRNIGKWSDSQCTITVTTQGIQRNDFIDFLSTFLRIADQNKFPVKLFIKMHPIYDQNPEVYRTALKSFGESVTVIAANEMPSTFELIKKSHLHISISSSCHYEALGLYVPTIILPFPTYEMVTHLYLSGHAYLAQSPGDLFEIVRNWRQYHVSEEISSYYFEPDTLKNLLAEFRR
jgi:hypothetical protein